MTGVGKPRFEVGLLHLAVVVSVALPTENKNSLLSAADVVKEGTTLIVSMDNAFASAYAVAGYPAVTVPAGQNEFTGPSGLTFTGGYLQDGEVLGFAYSFEQASALREAPTVRGDVPKDE